MRESWRRLTAALLTVAMILALLPLTGAGTAFAANSYGKTVGSSVAIRKTASTSGDIWFRVDEGTVATVLGTAALAAMLSLLTSVAGLPELDNDIRFR